MEVENIRRPTDFKSEVVRCTNHLIRASPPLSQIPLSRSLFFFVACCLQLLRSFIMKPSVVSAILLFASVAAAAKDEFLHLGRLIPPKPEADTNPLSARAAVNTTGSGFFTQTLDHNDPSKGTFQQKYWWSSQNWAGPGSPVSHPESSDCSTMRAKTDQI